MHFLKLHARGPDAFKLHARGPDATLGLLTNYKIGHTLTGGEEYVCGRRYMKCTLFSVLL